MRLKRFGLGYLYCVFVFSDEQIVFFDRHVYIAPKGPTRACRIACYQFSDPIHFVVSCFRTKVFNVSTLKRKERLECLTGERIVFHKKKKPRTVIVRGFFRVSFLYTGIFVLNVEINYRKIFITQRLEVLNESVVAKSDYFVYFFCNIFKKFFNEFSPFRGR